MCPSASKDDFRQCWILLCIQSHCITLIQWLDNALQHVNLALLFNSTCSKTHCVKKKTLVCVTIQAQTQCILKKRILLLLPVNNPHAVIRQSWQTSRSNDEWRAWHPEASWQVQRVQKLKIHCTAEQSFGGFPVYAGRRFSEGRTSRG